MADSLGEREDPEDEVLEDDNPRDGEQIYEAWFDTDGIGSGGNDVYLYRGKYYFVTDEYQGEAMDTLTAAIRRGAGEINSCCSRIDCPSLKPEHLVRLLTVHDDSANLEINGEEWAFDEKTGWTGPDRSPHPKKRRRAAASRAASKPPATRPAGSGRRSARADSTQAIDPSGCLRDLQLDSPGLLGADPMRGRIRDDVPCSR